MSTTDGFMGENIAVLRPDRRGAPKPPPEKGEDPYQRLIAIGIALAAEMRRFRESGSLSISANWLAAARALFEGRHLDDEGTLVTIREVVGATGEVIDPHTAVGLAAAKAGVRDPSVPMVALACAHPAKFPDAVATATGVRPVLPERLAYLFEREERLAVLANDLDEVQAFVRARTRSRVPA